MMMSDEEVKNRIMQIAKGYRYERVKNEKIEKTLKKAQQDISSRSQQLQELNKVRASIQKINQVSDNIREEFMKVGSYKNTAMKQEERIVRLLKILKVAQDETGHLKTAKNEYQELAKENQRLKHQLENWVFDNRKDLIDDIKMKLFGYEKDIRDLREQLRS